MVLKISFLEKLNLNKEKAIYLKDVFYIQGVPHHIRSSIGLNYDFRDYK